MLNIKRARQRCDDAMVEQVEQVRAGMKRGNPLPLMGMLGPNATSLENLQLALDDLEIIGGWLIAAMTDQFFPDQAKERIMKKLKKLFPDAPEFQNPEAT